MSGIILSISEAESLRNLRYDVKANHQPIDEDYGADPLRGEDRKAVTGSYSVSKMGQLYSEAEIRAKLNALSAKPTHVSSGSVTKAVKNHTTLKPIQSKPLSKKERHEQALQEHVTKLRAQDAKRIEELELQLASLDKGNQFPLALELDILKKAAQLEDKAYEAKRNQTLDLRSELDSFQAQFTEFEKLANNVLKLETTLGSRISSIFNRQKKTEEQRLFEKYLNIASNEEIPNQETLNECIRTINRLNRLLKSIQKISAQSTDIAIEEWDSLNKFTKQHDRIVGLYTGPFTTGLTLRDIIDNSTTKKDELLSITKMFLQNLHEGLAYTLIDTNKPKLKNAIESSSVILTNVIRSKGNGDVSIVALRNFCETLKQKIETFPSNECKERLAAVQVILEKLFETRPESILSS